MAVLTSSDANKIFVEAFFDELRKAPILANYCNRRWEADMQDARSIRRPRNTTSMSTSAYSGGDYATPSAISLSGRDLSWKSRRQIGHIIDSKDMHEHPADLVAFFGMQQAKAVSEWRDGNIEDQWRGLYTADPTNVQETYHLSSNVTKDHYNVVGTATNYVDPADGLIKTGTKGTGGDYTDIVFDEILRMRMVIRQQHKANYNWHAVMPAHLVQNLLIAVADKHDVLALNQVEGRDNYRLFGIFDIVEYELEALADPDISGKTHYPIFFVASEGTTIGMRSDIPKLVTPESSEAGAAWKLYWSFDWYADVEDPRFVYCSNFRGEA